MTEATDAYRIPGYTSNCVAVYLPQFHQIWTNPQHDRKTVDRALREEVIHATQTCFRPSGLLPTLNFLRGSNKRPTHEEFRDIVEALYFAAQPLAYDKPIDPARPPRIQSPYRDLGIRILKAACRLAEYGHRSQTLEDNRRQALWSVLVSLSNVVPLRRDMGWFVLECIDEFVPSNGWLSATELTELLLKHLSCVQRSHKDAARFIKVLRPNNSHVLIFRAVDMIADFLRAPMDRVVAALPVLLSALTLDVHRTIYLLRLQQHGDRLLSAVETWQLTHDNIKSTETALRSLLRGDRSGGDEKEPCVAIQFHIRSLEFTKQIYHRFANPSAPFVLHEALEYFLHLLNTLILAPSKTRSNCRLCNAQFCDEKFMHRAKRISSLGPKTKFSLLLASTKHHAWLTTTALGLAKEAFGVPKRTSSGKPEERIHGPKNQKPSKPAAYRFASPSEAPWALYLPALGQIWMLPECPAQLMIQIQSHELRHYGDCSLQPAHLLHLRSVLLDRGFPEPHRFNDLIEACYVVGLTLEAGFPPLPRHFPPADQGTRVLAKKISDLAGKLARSAKPHVDKSAAKIEAAHAVILLLRHVIPTKAFDGDRILSLIRRLRAASDWQNRWELWPMLQRNVFEYLSQAKEAPCGLAWPMDPHRSVAEMLVFLSHCSLPIPERRAAIEKTLPSLLSLLSLGSVVWIPFVQIEKKSGAYEARISIIESDELVRAHIEKVVQVLSESLEHSRNHRENCICLHLFVGILKSVRSCQPGSDSRSIKQCLSKILNEIQIRKLRPRSFTCAACRQHLSAKTVREAVELLSHSLPLAGVHLHKAAATYPYWLRTGALRLIQESFSWINPLRLVSRQQSGGHSA